MLVRSSTRLSKPPDTNKKGVLYVKFYAVRRMLSKFHVVVKMEDLDAEVDSGNESHWLWNCLGFMFTKISPHSLHFAHGTIKFYLYRPLFSAKVTDNYEFSIPGLQLIFWINPSVKLGLSQSSWNVINFRRRCWTSIVDLCHLILVLPPEYQSTQFRISTWDKLG